VSRDTNPNTQRQCLRIGLTGGIGSGKSTVAQLFAAHGVPVIDADEIGRALSQPGEPTYHDIVAHFGRDILKDDREIDRAHLRTRVFENPEERARLEAILHPRIRAEMRARAERASAAYCLMVVPLLIETGQDADMDRVLVVDAPKEQQIERVMVRGLSREEVARVMRAQVGRETRLARAHDWIENDGDLAHLEREVDRLHRFYLGLAGKHGN